MEGKLVLAFICIIENNTKEYMKSMTRCLGLSLHLVRVCADHDHDISDILGTCYAFLMAFTPLMYFYHVLCILTYMYCEKKTNKIELN